MPVIKKGSDYMQAVTYTGNGSTQTINVGFQPDLVWIKSRSVAADHKLVDSVRGATLALSSNTTGAEVTDSTGITAFTSTGFTLGANSTYNTNAATYVAWCWKKGATPGFDIVTYTGTGSANRAIPHSLGVAPKMVIVKNRTFAANWNVWFTGFTADEYLLLNTTGAKASFSGQWGSVPTSTNFYVGSNNGVNGNTDLMVAYLFAEIAGFSKFGSYTGNLNADGPYVYLGFRPKLVMWKRTDSTGDWIIFDSSRDAYNYAEKQLVPNTSGAEQVTGGGFVRMDFLSNGFKVRSTDSYINASGGTYIFAAFAENPFKYSNAR